MKNLIFFKISTAICAVMFGILLFSCKEQNNVFPDNIAESEVMSDYTIPVESALAELRATLNALDAGNNNQEKFASRVFKSDVRAISKLQPCFRPSKIKGVQEEETPLLYLVDFEESKGWAVLSADSRVESKVLAIMEQGNYSDFEREYVDITDDLNGFELYNEEYNEYAVAGMIDLPKNEKLMSLCHQYAQNEITSFSGGGWEPFFDYDSVLIIEHVKEKIPPLLETLWGQGAPYNNNCPNKPNCGTSNGKAWAGCVTIALAQIMTYNNYPHWVPGLWDMNAPFEVINQWNMTDEQMYCWCWGMTRFEWIGNINHGSTPTPNNQDYVYLARYIRQLFDDVICIYGNQGSFGFPTDAGRALQKYGYRNVKRYSVFADTDIDSKIRNMLLNNKPVFFSAISDIVNGHAWVIDGFLQMELEKLYYKNGEQFSIGNEVIFLPIKNYLHCNWGWNGSCNGYFASKVFDLRNGPSHVDTAYGDDNGTRNRYYNWGAVMITYDVPPTFYF